MFPPNVCSLILILVISLCGTSFGRNLSKRQANNKVFIAQCGERTGRGAYAIVAAAGRGVANSCYKYTLLCLTFDNQLKTFDEQCSVGLWWNNRLNTCEYPDSQARPECAAEVCRPPFGTPPGQAFVNPDPRACYGLYECYPLDVGYNAHFEMCENSHFFDPTIGECRDTLPSICTRPEPALRPCLVEKQCTEPGLVWSNAYCRCVHPSRYSRERVRLMGGGKPGRVR